MQMNSWRFRSLPISAVAVLGTSNKSSFLKLLLSVICKIHWNYDLYCFPCVALKFSVALNFRKFHCKRSKTKFVESWLFNTKPFTLLL